MQRLGHRYDLKNVFDLARYLLPLPVPARLRGRLLAFGSGDPSLEQVRTEAQVALDRERRRLAREAAGEPPRDPGAAEVPTATSSGRAP